jgi:hypothetical protein
MELSLDLAAFRSHDLLAAAEQHRLVTAARAELRAVRLARRAELLRDRALRLATSPSRARA